MALNTEDRPSDTKRSLAELYLGFIRKYGPWAVAVLSALFGTLGLVVPKVKDALLNTTPELRVCYTLVGVAALFIILALLENFSKVLSRILRNVWVTTFCFLGLLLTIVIWSPRVLKSFGQSKVIIKFDQSTTVTKDPKTLSSPLTLLLWFTVINRGEPVEVKISAIWLETDKARMQGTLGSPPSALFNSKQKIKLADVALGPKLDKIMPKGKIESGCYYVIFRDVTTETPAWKSFEAKKAKITVSLIDAFGHTREESVDLRNPNFEDSLDLILPQGVPTESLYN